MPELIIELNLSAEKLLAYYRGEIRGVQARAITGQTVQFPVAALQKLISSDGIHGQFRIEFDENHKFVRLEPVHR
jgi:Protein of unknown function (DUF2835)